ncbi:class I SAM-dependent methyltransferase [Caminibacter pacificus]
MTKELIESTLNYYNKNANSLVERYEKANLKKLQEYILKFVDKNDFILELGFGSGREINFLLKNCFENIYGIDGCEEFVKKARERFKSNNFYFSILPDINIPKNIKFDFIYSIAVWMHLPTEVYEETVNNIINLLKENGKVLLSFSLDERREKGRYFQKVDEILLETLFKKNNMKKLDEIVTVDSLNRKIQWKSVIYGKN